jgi:2-polyprenyl-6-methoxyphenol hydroxylase-like FAD-dependent oxidoreductase
MCDGREVWKEDRGLAAGYDWPQIAIHRGRFHLFLLDAVRRMLGSDAVRTSMKLSRFEHRAGGVAAFFTNERTGGEEVVEADVLIGADGIHSAVRRELYPDEGRPIWNGVSLFRGTTRLPAGAMEPRMLWCGHADQKFIAYPIFQDRGADELTLNWVCDLRTAEPGAIPREEWNRSIDPSYLVKRFADWRWDGLDIPALLRGSEFAFEFPMVDRDPLPRWSFSRVTLAGDAAHPMYPIGSNGATQGIIDARALAFTIATSATAEAALAEYELLRREATSRIVLGNRKQGPDIVLQLARERAPDPTIDLAGVLPLRERAEIAQNYKRLAGFEPEALRNRQSFSLA